MAVNMDFRFDDQLLNDIKFHRNHEAKIVLRKMLAKKSDGLGTLLHQAAYYDNAKIVKRLIELGSDINFIGADGKTPLMVAAKHECLASVKVLLHAGANVNIVDAEGQSVLQMVFNSDYVNTAIIEAFIYKLQADRLFDTSFDVAKILVAAGCAPHHAMILKNVEIIRFMLQIRCLGLPEVIQTRAAVKKDPAVIFVCLELDGEPRDENYVRDHAILDMSFSNESATDLEKSDDLVEYLSKIGELTAFDIMTTFCTLDCDDDWLVYASNAVHTLIAHTVMLKKLDASIVKIAKCFEVEWHDDEMSKFEKYHERCQQILDTLMLKNSTLFDLVTDENGKMREYVRNESFESIIDGVCSEYQLNELSPYYLKLLKIRISRAKQAVELEEKAITFISKIFNINYNHCYNFGRQIVGYLNIRELEWLCMLCD